MLLSSYNIFPSFREIILIPINASKLEFAIILLILDLYEKFPSFVNNCGYGEQVKKKRMSYMDAVISYCSENGIDPSNTKGLINKTLKEKVAYEAQSLNMLKEKTAKLPI